MIKTILDYNIENLDRKANEFMKTKKKNLPVRTEMVVIPSDIELKILHKCTIFYDERFESNSVPTEDLSEINTNDDEKIGESKSQNRGSLWINNGKIKGYWNEKPISLNDDNSEKLTVNGKLNLVLDGIKAIVIKNKFKEKEKQPDYVILESNK